MSRFCERVARPASTGWNLAKTALQIVVCWSWFYALLPSWVSRAERAWVPGAVWTPAASTRVAALAVFATFGAVALASAWVFAKYGRGTPLPADTTRKLVIAGPYRYVRNPMAVTGVAQFAAVAIWHGSTILLSLAAFALLIWNYVIRPWEERQLSARFGPPYEVYRRRVRCWRPRWRGYDPANEGAEPVLSADRTSPPGHPVLVYDGGCSFCRAGVDRILCFTGRAAMETITFRDGAVFKRFPGLRPEACTRAMHFVAPDGRVYAGFEAGVRAVLLGPAIGRLAMGYYLPGVRLACDLVYAWVARRRFRLGRWCNGATCGLA